LAYQNEYEYNIDAGVCQKNVEECRERRENSIPPWDTKAARNLRQGHAKKKKCVKKKAQKCTCFEPTTASKGAGALPFDYLKRTELRFF
jgi:hypothetical protein